LHLPKYKSRVNEVPHDYSAQSASIVVEIKFGMILSGTARADAVREVSAVFLVQIVFNTSPGFI
jgi:hypothetical protein